MIEYRTDDRRPGIVYTIERNKEAVDLSEASAVNARIRLCNTTTTLFNNELTPVTDGSDGKYLLQFTDGQLADDGDYEGEFKITWSAGITETAPGYFYITVITAFTDP